MKKNNKGFSLVELIVVVLIMGIIAVALAPQVMKWVDTARTNTDESQEQTLKSSIRTAYAEYQYENGKIASGVGTASAPISLTSKADVASALGAASALADDIDEVLGGEYPTPKTGSAFVFWIDASGKVTVQLQ